MTPLRPIFVALLVFTCISKSLAQGEYYPAGQTDIYYLDFTPVIFQVPDGAKEVKFIHQRGKKQKTYLKRFNKEGKLTEFYSVAKNGKLKKIALLFYDTKMQLIKAEFYERNKLDYSKNYSYTENGSVASIENKNNENELRRKQTWKYNLSGCLMESSIYTGENSIPKYFYKHEYLDSCHKSKVALYKKGKLKEEWSYLCDKSGEKMEKKDRNTVCIWHESSNDTLIRVYETVDEKGRSNRYINTYTRKDTLILEAIKYDEKNRMDYHYTYDKSWDKVLTSVHYSNGVACQRSEYTYSGDRITSITYFYKSRPVSRVEYLYNKVNLLVEMKWFDEKNKMKSAMQFEYLR